MKRILFTATYAQPYLSGITDYIQRVTTHLAATENVMIQTFQHAPNVALQEKQNGVTLQRLKPNFKASKGFIRWSYPLDVWKAVAQADEVFINLPQVESIFVALAAKLQHKKLRVIYHCELVFETGVLQKLIAFTANLLAFCVCAAADTIIAYTADYAAQSRVLKYFKYKTVIVPPPVEIGSIDESYAKKLDTLINSAFPIIGFAGRISREKGLAYLVESLAELKKLYPNILLLCSGPFGSDVVGESDYFNSLQQLCRSHKIHTEFLGKITREQLTAFYSKITLLVLPSTNRTEAFGLVQVEAMLAGKPVVATDLPGVRSVVQATQGGIIVPVKNSRALTAAIQKILENPSKFNSKKIIENIQKKFSKPKTLKFFSELIAA